MNKAESRKIENVLAVIFSLLFANIITLAGYVIYSEVTTEVDQEIFGIWAAITFMSILIVPAGLGCYYQIKSYSRNY